MGALFTHRRLLWQLARHDLKSRYAATLLGTIWAVGNSLILLGVLWAITVHGLRVGGEGGHPMFHLLLTGFLPWIAFQEAVASGAQAVIGKGWLVKKIAFPLDILPAAAVLAALGLHAVLLPIGLVLLLLDGGVPGWAWLGLPYYTLGLALLALALAWLTAAASAASRDLGQAVTMLLTVWFWVTPVVWPLANLPEPFAAVARANPVTFIVEGYRACLLDGRWPGSLWPADLVFWLTVAVLLGLGQGVYRRLAPHFADLL